MHFSSPLRNAPLFVITNQRKCALECHARSLLKEPISCISNNIEHLFISYAQKSRKTKEKKD